MVSSFFYVASFVNILYHNDDISTMDFSFLLNCIIVIMYPIIFSDYIRRLNRTKGESTDILSSKWLLVHSVYQLSETTSVYYYREEEFLDSKKVFRKNSFLIIDEMLELRNQTEEDTTMLVDEVCLMGTVMFWS